MAPSGIACDLHSAKRAKTIALVGICLALFAPSNLGVSADSAIASVHTTVGTDLNAAVLIPRFDFNSTSYNPSSSQPKITLYNGTVITPLCCGGGSLYSRPYEGGWQTGDHSVWGVATAVRAQITFPNTSPSSIPSGNWLEGTINLQGQDYTYKGLDYLMRAAHVLYPDGHHGLVADMWKDCEGLPGNTCGAPSATELTAFILNIYGLSAGQTIYVQMQDSNNVLYWYYSYDGNTWYQYYSYAPPSTFKQVFYLGTTGIISGPYFTAYYYQFGFWAQSQWSCIACFDVQIKNPSYYKAGTWSTVQTAESMSGPYTYFDQDWNLASSGYYAIGTTNHNPSPQVDFYACPLCRPLPDKTKLWG